MNSDVERLRETMWSYIKDREFGKLFMRGGCHIYALVLHEMLRRPLFYTSQGTNDFPHAFVMMHRSDKWCFDYEGKKPVADVIAKYGHRGASPQPVTDEVLKDVIKQKNFGEALEQRMFEIAHSEFIRQRQLYRAQGELVY